MTHSNTNNNNNTNNNKYFLDNNFFLKYFYFYLGLFFKINFIFIDYLPDDFSDIVFFYKNTMIRYEIYDNYNKYKEYIDVIYDDKISYNSNLLDNFKDKLTDEQFNFYKTLENANNENIKDNNIKQFLYGFYHYFHILNNFNHFSNDDIINNIWESSFDGNLVIDMCIKKGVN
jgi:hypothetical protein